MALNRQLKIKLFKDQSEYERNIQKILSELTKVDPASFLQPIEKAVASRSLVKKLWDLLPDEQDCFGFNSVEEQTIAGRLLLPTSNLTQVVTMHLGWDVLSFSCSLEAAWQTWLHFNTLNTDTFNCCIYPANIDWYVVRAGTNFYPMTFLGNSFQLNSKKSN